MKLGHLLFTDEIEKLLYVGILKRYENEVAELNFLHFELNDESPPSEFNDLIQISQYPREKCTVNFSLFCILLSSNLEIT